LPDRPRAPQRQRGSILVSAAGLLFVGVLLLGGVQLGYKYYLQRELQKTADLAALSGAQALGGGDAAGCASALAAAAAAVSANLSDLDTPAYACRRWDPTDASLAGQTPPYLRDPQDDERHNAVHVALSAELPRLLPFLPAMRAEAQAVAKADPLAAFSVGSRLASTSTPSGVLTNLLKGVGLDLDGTGLVGYDTGLAGVKITPGGLLDALGIPVPADITVGGLNELLSTDVSLGELLDAVVKAGGRDDLLSANAGLLQAIQAKLGVSDLNVRLGTEEEGRASSLFTRIDAPDAKSALGVQLDALQVLATAIGVGTGKHAVQADLDLEDPLGLIKVKPRVSVIEPPSIAIGGVGATAYTSQIRAYVPIQISTAQMKGLGGVLKNLVDVTVDLPITVDAVDGKAILQDMCHARDDRQRPLAHIAAQSSILKICVGGPPAEADAQWPFSTSASCDDGLTDKQLFRVKVLGTDLASLNTKLTVDALRAEDDDDFHEGQTRQLPPDGNPLEVGTTVRDVTDALLAALLGNTLKGGTTMNGADQQKLRQDLATQIWNDTAALNTCNPSASGSTGYQCRDARWKAGLAEIERSSTGLKGFLGATLGNSLDLLDNLLTLDVLGLLGNVGNLVGDLVGAVGDVLAGLLGSLIPTNACASGSLLGGYQGNETGCINELANALKNTSPPSSTQPPNAVLALVGMLLETLRPVLDDLIGQQVLKPLIEQVVGLQVGQTDVTLMSLDCDGKGVQLVY